MISANDAIRILKVHSGCFKRAAYSLKPEDEQYLHMKQGVEAIDFALNFMTKLEPVEPVYSSALNSYKCGVCGCPVGFQVRPGVRCYACPQCMQRVKWTGIDFD